ncbi:MAG: oligosaccharide flippase family protein, partial [Actinobacteria bacterium]|nr:oligosaccharide flippase family protein [Actinomycetota bacterium]
RQCLLYSIPLIPNIAGGWITGLSDRLIIAKFINLESVGLYSLASQIAALLYIIQDAITQVTGPISMSGLVHDKESTKLKIGKLSLFLWGLMLWAVLALSLFSQEIIFIFAAKDYKEASQIIWVMGFVYILSSQYRIFSDIISYHKKTWIITAAGLIMAGTSFVLNCILCRYLATRSPHTFLCLQLSCTLHGSLLGQENSKRFILKVKKCSCYLFFS